MAQITIDLGKSPLQGFTSSIKPFEPRRRNLFVWHIQGIGPDSNKIEEAIYYARTLTIPSIDIPAVEDHYITAKWYVHGAKWDFPEIRVEFLFSYQDESKKDMYTSFFNWLKKVTSWISPFHAGVTGEYESTGYIVLLTPNLKISKIYQLVRCWPRSIGDIDLGYDSGDILRVGVTFRYDRMFMMDVEGV